jgi:hypothetical protein
MPRIAIVNTVEATVIEILPIADGQVEVATRVSLPGGLSISPVELGWSNDAIHEQIPDPNAELPEDAPEDWAPPLVDGDVIVAEGTYTVLPVVDFVVPEGKVTSGQPAYAVGETDVVESFDVIDPPAPDRVTSRQFNLALLAMPPIAGGDTLLDDVEAWIATQPRPVQVAFRSSSTFVRTEPMMQLGFTALGFSGQQIDDFFRTASAL